MFCSVVKSVKMEREAIQQSQKGCGDTTKMTPSGPSPISTHAAETVGETRPPILPRLTPNPTLSSPILTPSSTSPPPPLTPAPLLTASPTLKTGTPSPFQHSLLPTPPKLTSTLSPNLRTYSRPINPSPTGKTRVSSAGAKPAPLISTAPTLTPLSASSTEASITSISSSSSVTYGNLTSSHKNSPAVANGNTRPTSVPISTPITPFHTPASPTGRQVPHAHPFASPGHIQANQSSSHVAQRISQQALLLGRDLKGSSHDQVLLRAQMLQSLTLRPPPPGTLTIPPSLRLKLPSSAPPPFSRPRTPLFPPIRPRPQPSAVTTTSHTAPTRHLSVPPPTLYSAVRAVPLRPRLHSPNGHRTMPPRQSATLQPLPAAAAARQMPPVDRQFAGLKTSQSPQTAPTPGQTQTNSVSVGHASCFEQSPSAARQLQIIALSSGRQSQFVNGAHATALVQSMCPVVEPPAAPLNDRSPQTLGSKVKPVLCLSPPPKTSPPLPSSPSPLRPSSPQPRASLSTHSVRQQGETEDPREKESVTEDKLRIQDNGGPEKKKGGASVQTENQKEQKNMMEEKQIVLGATERHREEEMDQKSELDEEERMEGIEKDQAKQNKACVEVNEEKAMDQSENQPAPIASLHKNNMDLDPSSASLSKHEPENKNKPEAVPNPNESDEESETLNESPNSPWAQKAWPDGGKQVLTHLVEGFVIQEGLQPFPVINRSSLLVPDQVGRSQDTKGINGTEASPLNDSLQESEPLVDREGHASDEPKTTETGEKETPVLHCQFCGKKGHVHNFMRSKRFCSTSCARGFNVRLTKRLRALSAGSRPESRQAVLNRTESVPGKPLLLRLPRELWSASPLSPRTTRERRKAARRARRASEPAGAVSSLALTSPSGPAQWTVEEVANFIHTLPGGIQVAEEFRLQEIDGQALLLLTEDHLMTSMNIKLGPALKICAHINALKHH
ncbi:polyhomeotic-like protein 3 [Aplochiton taeniatus]